MALLRLAISAISTCCLLFAWIIKLLASKKYVSGFITELCWSGLNQVLTEGENSKDDKYRNKGDVTLQSLYLPKLATSQYYLHRSGDGLT